MNKRLLIYFVIFLGTIFSIQGMETSSTVMFSYLPEALQRFSKRDKPTSGAFNNITSSYFLDKLEYIKVAEELIFRDWEFKNKDGRYDFSPITRLLADACNCKKIKEIYNYGAEKRVLPYSYEPVKYIPAKGYSKILSLKKLITHEMLEKIKVGNYTSFEEKFAKVPQGLLEVIFDYPDFPEDIKSQILEIAQKNTNLIITHDEKDEKDKIDSHTILEHIGYLKADENFKIEKDEQETIKRYLAKERCGNYILKSKNIPIHKEDYKTETYTLLEEIFGLPAIEGELKEKIDSCLFNKEYLSYNKKNIGKLFNNIVSLPKLHDNHELDKEYKEKIFSLLIKIYFDGKFLPLKLLNEAVAYYAYLNDYKNSIWAEYGFQQYFQLYKWVVDYGFQEYPLYLQKLLHI